jgi:hypothetical protein
VNKISKREKERKGVSKSEKKKSKGEFGNQNFC